MRIVLVHKSLPGLATEPPIILSIQNADFIGEIIINKMNNGIILKFNISSFKTMLFKVLICTVFLKQPVKVRGQIADEGSWPFLVSLQFKNKYRSKTFFDKLFEKNISILVKVMFILVEESF